MERPTDRLATSTPAALDFYLPPPREGEDFREQKRRLERAIEDVHKLERQREEAEFNRTVYWASREKQFRRLMLSLFFVFMCYFVVVFLYARWTGHALPFVCLTLVFLLASLLTIVRYERSVSDM